MNNTIGLGYVVTPVPTSPILFFFQTSPHNANDLEILQNFGFYVKTTKYWYQLLAFCFPTPYFI